MPKIKRALVSVSDKKGIISFSKKLSDLGIEIISTGGTARALKDAGINVMDVSDYTGSPEILDGRLKTLHPKIHGGLLGIRGNADHVQQMKTNGIEPIDLVVVNLYPFEETISKKDCSFEDAVENIDIGGPTMLRAAAKNWQDVAVVVDPGDYESILSELKQNKGEISEKTCFDLARKVFSTTARYDAAICNYINSADFDGRPKQGIKEFADTIAKTFVKVQDLRYGENPHQKAAFYKCAGLQKSVPVITNGIQLHGKELSYNNIMDSDAAFELVKEFAGQKAAVIIKHTNPCGAAVSAKSLADAFTKARDSDPVSAFGGIVALTKEADEDTAKEIGDTFFEVIIAPGFSEGALGKLKAKKNLRLLFVPSLEDNCPPEKLSFRKVGGGVLFQTPDNAVVSLKDCKVVTKKNPAPEELAALDFAWKLVKHVKSNAIVISGNGVLLGVGAGQTSRVDSVRIAVSKMHEHTKGYNGPKVLASDAFFPFRDGIDIAAKEGITAIVQPGGSIKDEDTIKAANEHGISMIFTGIRHFKH